VKNCLQRLPAGPPGLKALHCIVWIAKLVEVFTQVRDEVTNILHYRVEQHWQLVAATVECVGFFTSVSKHILARSSCPKVFKASALHAQILRRSVVSRRRRIRDCGSVQHDGSSAVGRYEGAMSATC
jgi:hypothetical protein